MTTPLITGAEGEVIQALTRARQRLEDLPMEWASGRLSEVRHAPIRLATFLTGGELPSGSGGGYESLAAQLAHVIADHATAITLASLCDYDLASKCFTPRSSEYPERTDTFDAALLFLALQTPLEIVLYVKSTETSREDLDAAFLETTGRLPPSLMGPSAEDAGEGEATMPSDRLSAWWTFKRVIDGFFLAPMATTS